MDSDSTPVKPLPVRAVSEFFGSFVLTVAFIGAVSSGGNAPWAVGGMLAALVFVLAPVSGAHLNPAVSIASLIAGRARAVDTVVYVLVQVAAAFPAGYVGAWMYSGSNALAGGDGQAWVGRGAVTALVAEFVLVLVLALIALTAARHDATIYALGAGVAVVAGMNLFATVSTGVFNGAVACGLVVANVIVPANLWVYGAAHMAAAVVGGLLFRVFDRESNGRSAASAARESSAFRHRGDREHDADEQPVDE